MSLPASAARLLVFAAARARWLPAAFAGVVGRSLRPGNQADGMDIGFRHFEVQACFAGLPFYGPIEQADHPPATQLFLWP